MNYYNIGQQMAKNAIWPFNSSPERPARTQDMLEREKKIRKLMPVIIAFAKRKELEDYKERGAFGDNEQEYLKAIHNIDNYFNDNAIIAADQAPYTVMSDYIPAAGNHWISVSLNDQLQPEHLTWDG